MIILLNYQMQNQSYFWLTSLLAIILFEIHFVIAIVIVTDFMRFTYFWTPVTGSFSKFTMIVTRKQVIQKRKSHNHSLSWMIFVIGKEDIPSYWFLLVWWTQRSLHTFFQAQLKVELWARRHNIYISYLKKREHVPRNWQVSIHENYK